MRRLTTMRAGLALFSLFSLGALGVLCGCGSSGSGSCDAPSNPAAFEMGTGEVCFERLTPGQVVPEIAGPQGGFHVWTAVGCSDCGAEAIVEFGTKQAKTKAWLLGVPEKQLVDLGTGEWGQHAGLTAFLPGDTTSAPDEQLPKGTHVILSLRVLSDKGDELHAAEREVVLGDVVAWSGCSTAADTCGTSGFEPCCAN
jgi:hypothetical protein